MVVQFVIYPQLLRYFIAGVLNTLLAYTLFAVAIYVGLHYALAVLLGGALPLLTGYHAQRRYVFMCSSRNRLPRFLAAFALVYLVNVGILKGLLGSGLAGDAYVSGAMALVPSMLLSFLLNKYIVFR